MADPIAVYLEVGEKRVFAGALEWPGWCRAGRDEAAALAALATYAKRYKAVLAAADVGAWPGEAPSFDVVERLPGSTTTDFGAPGAIPSADRGPFGVAELAGAEALLQAGWRAFDAAVAAAAGRELRKGPRGGGRELGSIIAHVAGAERGYLSGLAWRAPKVDDGDPAAVELTRRAVLEALAAAARGELPAHKPRGSPTWPPRYFVRRVAWHLFDHLWEIEDRSI